MNTSLSRCALSLKYSIVSKKSSMNASFADASGIVVVKEVKNILRAHHSLSQINDINGAEIIRQVNCQCVHCK